MPENKPPVSADAEKAVLGICILSGNAAIESVALLGVDDFFFVQHQVIFGAILTLVGQGAPIDLVSLVEALTDSDKLRIAGGAGYVSSLIDGVARSTNLGHYAGIVARKAKLRRLIHCLHACQEQAHSAQDADTNAVIEQVIPSVLGVMDSGRDVPTARDWPSVMASAVGGFEEAVCHPDLSKRINFGLDDLDRMTGGLRRRNLVELVAPTSNGKTLLAAQAAFRASRDGFKVLFFSAEMPAEDIAMRELAFLAGVPFYMTQCPERCTEADLGKIKSVPQAPGPRIVDRGITPARIWAMAEAAKRTVGLDFAIVDYDQLAIEAGMDPNADDDNVFSHQRAFIFKAKQVAERLDICFLFLSQLRKVSPSVQKGNRPHLDDIWGDSSVRNTPQVILWVSREFFAGGMKEEDERKATIYVLKNRNGRVGMVNLEFDPLRLRFLDAPPTEADSMPESTWQKQQASEPQEEKLFP